MIIKCKKCLGETIEGKPIIKGNVISTPYRCLTCIDPKNEMYKLTTWVTKKAEVESFQDKMDLLHNTNRVKVFISDLYYLKVQIDTIINKYDIKN